MTESVTVTERDREIQRDESAIGALKLALSFALFLAENLHLSIGEEFHTFPCKKFAPYFLPYEMPLSSHFPLPKTLHSLKLFGFFALSNGGGQWFETAKQKNEFPAALFIFSSKNRIKLIPKTIGKRKMLCVRLRSGDKHHMRISAFRKAQIRKAFVRRSVFSGGFYPPSTTSRTPSFLTTDLLA